MSDSTHLGTYGKCTVLTTCLIYDGMQHSPIASNYILTNHGTNKSKTTESTYNMSWSVASFYVFLALGWVISTELPPIVKHMSHLLQTNPLWFQESSQEESSQEPSKASKTFQTEAAVPVPMVSWAQRFRLSFFLFFERPGGWPANLIETHQFVWMTGPLKLKHDEFLPSKISKWLHRFRTAQCRKSPLLHIHPAVQHLTHYPSNIPLFRRK